MHPRAARNAPRPCSVNPAHSTSTSYMAFTECSMWSQVQATVPPLFSLGVLTASSVPQAEYSTWDHRRHKWESAQQGDWGLVQRRNRRTTNDPTVAKSLVWILLTLSGQLKLTDLCFGRIRIECDRLGVKQRHSQWPARYLRNQTHQPWTTSTVQVPNPVIFDAVICRSPKLPP